MRWRERLPSAGELALWRRATGELGRREGGEPAPRRDPTSTALQGGTRRSSTASPRAEAPSPPPPLDDASAAAWLEALGDVTPLPGRAPPPAVATVDRPEAIVAPPPRPAAPLRPASAPRSSQRLDRSRPVDLDRRSWLKLRRGLYPIDARLDLHGLDQEQAHRTLHAFLADARTRGHRCVLVITGRGLRRGGTLRAATPRWLDTPPLRPNILAYADAQLRHGGDGALYVLLRRGG